MKKSLLKGISLLLVSLCTAICSRSYAQSNDHIFPASASAKPYIDFDSRGFIVNGKRTFLVSAGLEYARIPHELWHDRLLRLKRDGFNCIEIYTFWNFHEPEEGKFDFSGDHDLNAFLLEVHKLGLYAIVRVGPYYCAEWDLGGYPHWLRYKPGLVVRSPNAVFEKYVDRFFGKLIPIVAKNQINRGGAVVMVQLENEHPLSWGTYIPDEYFAHLQRTALSLGLEVPYFFSGLHHGSDPAGNKANLDDPGRPNPWFTTEFWSVWYNLYGSTKRDADQYGYRTWKIIAHGGNGYNYYMAHGGTNFGYTNGHEDAASYDYGAAVGQTGDLRPIYYQFKRSALFARSFQDILENSVSSNALSKGFATNDSIVTNTRSGKSGSIVFLENHDSVSTTTRVNINNQQVPAAGPLTLSRWEFVPVVHDFSLTENVSIQWAVTRILGIQQEGNTKTIVVYGQPNSPGEIWFSTRGNIIAKEGSQSFHKAGNVLKLKWSFDPDKPLEYSFTDGNNVIRVLALNTELSDHTWFIEDGGIDKVVVGPQYVGDMKRVNNHVELETEQFWQRKDINHRLWVYGAGAVGQMQDVFPSIDHTTGLKLSVWQAKDASAPAQSDFDDRKWLASQDPLEMGADGDLSEDAWYRTGFDAKTAGWYKINVNEGGNRFLVFIDGKRVADGGVNNLQFQTTVGHHTLVIYSAQDGRDKLYGFTGELATTNIKGISGAVMLHHGKGVSITDWKMQQAKAEDVNGPVPAMDSAVAYVIGKRPHVRRKPGSDYTWFQAVIPDENGQIPASLYFGTVRKGWTVFVNGQKVGVSDRVANKPFSVPVVSNKGPGQPNRVTVFIAGKNGRGGLFRPVDVAYKDDVPLKNWKMKGGPGDFASINGWKPVDSSDTFDRPTFFKSHFEVKNLKSDAHPIWRITSDGLSHGFIWVNGHNLGAYPEKVPINSLYIPEPWLKDGANEIVIYDEYGAKPGDVRIQAEQASSRDINVIHF